MATDERINMVVKEIESTLYVIDELDGKLKAMTAKVNELQTELAELKKQAEAEKFPKKGDTYYAIDIDGEVRSSTWYDVEIDHKITSIGNRFKTREEAEKTVEFFKSEHEKLAILRDLSEFAEPADTPWRGHNHWHFLCSMQTGKFWYLKDDGSCTYKLPVVHFATKEDAEKAVKAVGEERIKKYLFGYKKEVSDADTRK